MAWSRVFSNLAAIGKLRSCEYRTKLLDIVRDVPDDIVQSVLDDAKGGKSESADEEGNTGSSLRHIKSNS